MEAVLTPLLMEYDASRCEVLRTKVFPQTTR